MSVHKIHFTRDETILLFRSHSRIESSAQDKSGVEMYIRWYMKKFGCSVSIFHVQQLPLLCRSHHRHHSSPPPPPPRSQDDHHLQFWFNISLSRDEPIRIH